MVIPIILVNEGDWAAKDLWHIYVPAMFIGLLAMGPAVILGEKRNKPKIVFLLSSALFIVVSVLISLNDPQLTLIALFIFFIAFNLIEPLIQSMVSKFVKANEKGRALGYTNSFAYIGTFLGGTGAGLFLNSESIHTLGYILVVLSLIWFIWTLLIDNPVPKGNIYLSYSSELEIKLENSSFGFIDEWYINRTENLIVIKYDISLHSEENLQKQLKS